MQSTDWPREHTQALSELHAKGMSYGEIAKEINARFGTAYTRNATLGRGKRIGLVAPKTAKPQRQPPRRKDKSKNKRKNKAMAETRASSRPTRPDGDRDQPVPQPVVKRAPPVLRCVGISPRLIAFDALEPGDCRYPYGGDKDGEPVAFCGHPRRQGSSYCTPHHEFSRDPDLTERMERQVVLRLVTAA
jgi:GcrA cell cycle regulator